MILARDQTEHTPASFGGRARVSASERVFLKQLGYHAHMMSAYLYSQLHRDQVV